MNMCAHADKAKERLCVDGAVMFASRLRMIFTPMVAVDGVTAPIGPGEMHSLLGQYGARKVDA